MPSRLLAGGREAVGRLLGLQVLPHTLRVDENEQVQLLAASAAARRVSIVCIGCVRNLLQGGGVGLLTEALRNYLAAVLTERLHALPLPGLLELGCLVGATLATRLTHKSFPPVIALLDGEVARLYGLYRPPLKPVPVSRLELCCVSTALAAKFEATMAGHAARQSRKYAKVGVAGSGAGAGAEGGPAYADWADAVLADRAAQGETDAGVSGTEGDGEAMVTVSDGDAGSVLSGGGGADGELNGDDDNDSSGSRAGKRGGKPRKAWFLPEKYVLANTCVLDASPSAPMHSPYPCVPVLIAGCCQVHHQDMGFPWPRDTTGERQAAGPVALEGTSVEWPTAGRPRW